MLRRSVPPLVHSFCSDWKNGAPMAPTISSDPKSTTASMLTRPERAQ
jgi:hypothetical protein